MSTFYAKGSANANNSGGSDTDAPDLSGSAATVAVNVITLDGSPDLSGLVTTRGPTNSTICLTNGSNANQKIFHIAGFDNTLKTVTVDSRDPNPTLSSSPSAWAIGGRVRPSDLQTFEGCLRGGDTVIYDGDASGTTAMLTQRNSGDSTDGPIVVKGKSGTRPVISNTAAGSSSVFAETGTPANWWFQDLEVQSQGSSGTPITVEIGCKIWNVKFSDAPSYCLVFNATGNHAVGCEFTGAVNGINLQTFTSIVWGNYFHDLTGVAVSFSGSSIGAVCFNIFDTNTGRHLDITGSVGSLSHMGVIANNLFYKGDGHGMALADADYNYLIANNLFLDNGNAGGEYNLVLLAGTELDYTSFCLKNIYSQAGARGGDGQGAAAKKTVNATESTSNPLLNDPDNKLFDLLATSPGKAFAYPGAFLGAGTGYLDAGPVQREEKDAVFGMFGGGGIVQR